MKVDERATKLERQKHQEGVKKLDELFQTDRVGDMFGLFVPQDQRWLTKSKAVRRIYRRARMKADPTWSARRRQRKRQRAARKAHR